MMFWQQDTSASYQDLSGGCWENNHLSEERDHFLYRIIILHAFTNMIIPVISCVHIRKTIYSHRTALNNAYTFKAISYCVHEPIFKLRKLISLF